MKKTHGYKDIFCSAVISIVLICVASSFSNESGCREFNTYSKKDSTNNWRMLNTIAMGVGIIEPGGDPEQTLSYWASADVKTFSQYISLGIAITYYKANTKSSISEGNFRNLYLGPCVKIIPTNRFKIKPYIGLSFDVGFIKRNSLLIKDIPNAIVDESRSDVQWGTNFFLGMKYPINSRFGFSLDVRYHLDGFDYYLGPVSSAGAFLGILVFY